MLRRALKKQVDRRERETEDAREAGVNAGFASGNAAGFASGHDAGREDGLIEGSGQRSCSDDPDVYWLPSCQWAGSARRPRPGRRGLRRFWCV